MPFCAGIKVFYVNYDLICRHERKHGEALVHTASTLYVCESLDVGCIFLKKFVSRGSLMREDEARSRSRYWNVVIYKHMLLNYSYNRSSLFRVQSIELKPQSFFAQCRSLFSCTKYATLMVFWPLRCGHIVGFTCGQFLEWSILQKNTLYPVL